MIIELTTKADMKMLKLFEPMSYSKKLIQTWGRYFCSSDRLSCPGGPGRGRGEVDSEISKSSKKYCNIKIIIAALFISLTN